MEVIHFYSRQILMSAAMLLAALISIVILVMTLDNIKTVFAVGATLLLSSSVSFFLLQELRLRHRAQLIAVQAEALDASFRQGQTKSKYQ